MALPLPRPAPRRARAGAEDTRADRVGDPARDGTQQLLRRRDALPDPFDAGGRTGLPRAGAAATRALVRIAAVAAAVQAAADGGRSRALLPDRAVLSRRGLPGRPHAGVPPARPR